MNIDEQDGIENEPEYSYGPNVHTVPNSYFKNGHAILFQPGIYFVGDLTPLLELEEIQWIEEKLSLGYDGKMELEDERAFAVWATLGSTAWHLDESRRQYCLSRPLIGIIKIRELEIDTRMKQGQVVSFPDLFECSCLDGEVEVSGKHDDFQKIRILNFGERVKFTLYEFNTCEGMRQKSEPRIKPVTKWRNQTQETTDPLDKFGLGVARFLNEVGLDPQGLDKKTIKAFSDMFEGALPFYADADKD